MTQDELNQVIEIVRDEVPRIVRAEIAIALRPFHADVNIAIRGLQAVCERLAINGKVQAAFERWEEERALERHRSSTDEDTQPSIRLSSVFPAGEEA
jgi:hypothetical protein